MLVEGRRQVRKRLALNGRRADLLQHGAQQRLRAAADPALHLCLRDGAESERTQAVVERVGHFPGGSHQRAVEVEEKSIKVGGHGISGHCTLQSWAGHGA